MDTPLNEAAVAASPYRSAVSRSCAVNLPYCLLDAQKCSELAMPTDRLAAHSLATESTVRSATIGTRSIVPDQEHELLNNQ